MLGLLMLGLLVLGLLVLDLLMHDLLVLGLLNQNGLWAIGKYWIIDEELVHRCTKIRKAQLFTVLMQSRIVVRNNQDVAYGTCFATP